MVRQGLPPPPPPMISDPTVPLMRRPRWLTTTTRPRTLSSRKARKILGILLLLLLLQSLGAQLTLSFRGRKGLLATKCTVLRAKSKALLGGVSGGLRIVSPKLSMDGGEILQVLLQTLILFLLMFCVCTQGLCVAIQDFVTKILQIDVN